VKLCLFSLRRNAGALREAPITLITVSDQLNSTEQRFFETNFFPIEFKVAPRLGATVHASKLNVFYSVEPESYDVLLYLDCDTVVRKPLDDLAKPVADGEVQFLCRRGGVTDRNRFRDFDKLVSKFCQGSVISKVDYDNGQEWPMFNSGVFVASSEAVSRLRRYSLDFTYRLFNEWQRIDAFEGLPILRYLFRLGFLPSRQAIIQNWTLEQGALALACIKSGVKVAYMDERYNSWGNIDFHILHCFKSAYRFNRETMYSSDADQWLNAYSQSTLAGKVFLASIIREFKRDLQVHE
jgi:hypothetical protein